MNLHGSNTGISFASPTELSVLTLQITQIIVLQHSKQTSILPQNIFMCSLQRLWWTKHV